MPASKGNSFTRNRVTAATVFLIVIFTFGVGMRLINLGRWAYHHDESIHAWYSYRLCTFGRFDDAGGHVYRYDPVYHGPFLYHIGALFFFLFGDNDFTGRLPFAAFGIVMLLIVYQLHHIIGKPRAILALLFVALSPGLAYFARFARNDIYIATEAAAMVLFGLLYLRRPRLLWFSLLAFSFALLYSTKENSYVVGFVFCSFLGLYVLLRVLWDGIFEKDWKATLRLVLTDYFELAALVGLYGIFALMVFWYIRVPIEAQKENLLEMARASVEKSITRGMARTGFSAYLADHESFPAMVRAVGILCVFVFMMALNFARTAFRGPVEAAPKAPQPPPRAAEFGFLKRLLVVRLRLEKIPATVRRFLDRHPLLAQILASVLRALKAFFAVHARLLAALAIIAVVYVILFTTMFANLDGITDGITDYVRYWYAQKFMPRIAQAELGPYYYVYFFIIYDLAAFILAVAGIAYYSSRALLRVLSNIFQARLDLPEPEGGEPPLAVPVFLSYWTLAVLLLYATLHERVPWLYTHQALPVALLAGYFLAEMYLRLRRRKWIWIPAATVVTLVALFSLRANILLNLYRGDDSREVMVYVQSNRAVREIVREVEDIAYRAGTFEKTQIGVSGTAQWPFSWYFRRYRSVPGGRDKRFPVNIADPKDHSQLQLVLGDEFEFTKYSFRDHWSPNYDPRILGERFSKRWWRNQLRYFFYREPWSPVGGAELMFYRKRQIRDVPRVISCPAGFDRPPRPGLLVKSWGQVGSDPGQFRAPRGLAVSPDGHLYVCDSQNFRVQKFTLDGEFVLQLGGATSPADMEPGKFAGRHTGPGGVACDPQGFIYVADTWGHRIQKFDGQGNFITSWTPAPGDQFFGPRDLAADTAARIYVADTGNKRVMVYDGQGTFLNLRIGGEGSAPGELIEPVGIDISPQQELLVADVGNKRIQVFNTGGAFVRQWNVCGWESEVVSAIEAYLAVGPDGTVYATDSTRNCVYQFTPDGRSVSVWGTSGAGPGQLLRPTGIAVDGDGFVYVADTDNHRISKYRKQ